jgi:ATP-dependent DNA helicase RecG
MNDEELEALLLNPESDRVERKESVSDPSRIRQAICAFANDLPNHNEPGVLFVGVHNDGTCADLPVTEELLLSLSGMRDDGNILPLPSMVVQRRTILGCELAVVEVSPSDAPPVRYNGRVWIRVGPRRATATLEEERRLSEKRRSRDLTFDLHPVQAASLADLDQDLFIREYVTSAVSPDVLDQNQRTIEQQLVSMRFLSADHDAKPTVVGLLVLGKAPTDFVPGAYLQFLRVDGTELTDPIMDRKEIHGPVAQVLARLDEVLAANIHTATDVRSAMKEISSPDYPLDALQQLVRNAVMHRDYQTSNAPVRITWFRDRIEIQNPGGPYGQVTRENFGQPGITDYRNPHLAEALKILGFVQRFGVGIQLARRALQENGNAAPDFNVQANHVLVTIRSRP